MAITEYNNNNSYNQPFISAAAGAGVGYGAWYGSRRLINKVRVPYIAARFRKIQQYNDENLRAAEKIIKDRNLPIKIVAPDQLSDRIELKGKKTRIIKKYEEIINKKWRGVLNSVKKGVNAFFLPREKTVCVNKEKFTSPVFHEIGHAVNFYQSNFWGSMQKMRMPSRLAPIILLGVALFTSKKTEEQKERQGLIGKTTTFIKENVGKLSALATLPILAEELRASHVGNRLAEKYLSGDALKSVFKTNKISALSYTSVTLITGVTAWLANKVRDKVAQ